MVLSTNDRLENYEHFLFCINIDFIEILFHSNHYPKFEGSKVVYKVFFLFKGCSMKKK